jgi:hypothetical protein
MLNTLTIADSSPRMPKLRLCSQVSRLAVVRQYRQSFLAMTANGISYNVSIAPLISFAPVAHMTI